MIAIATSINQLSLTNRWLMTIGLNLNIHSAGTKIFCNLSQLQAGARKWLDELPKYTLIPNTDLQNILQEIIEADIDTPEEEVGFLYRELMLCKNNTILALKP